MEYLALGALPLGSRLPGTRPKFLDFPKINKEGASVFSGEDRRGPKATLTLEHLRLAPVQPWVALEQETFWGLSGLRPKRLRAPSLIDFSGKSRNSGLVPGNRDPKSTHKKGVCSLAPLICQTTQRIPCKIMDYIHRKMFGRILICKSRPEIT